MEKHSPFLKGLFAAVFIGVLGYGLYHQAAPLFAAPCEKPLEYSIGEFDPRFGLSRAEFASALKDAAGLWNTTSGRVLVVATSSGGIPVNLAYGDEQKTAELGGAIDAEQSGYDAKRREVEELKDSFASAKEAYERHLSAHEARVAAYDAEVGRWNAQGGAPPSEYARLSKEQKDIASAEARLSGEADEVNRVVARINTAVGELNAFAAKLNAKVTTYNARAGTDFEQGNYVSDEEGKRINIQEFTSGTELRRVLAHELGHALGLDHVENPDSIMYSYDIGMALELTPEDLAELARACEFE